MILLSSSVSLPDRSNSTCLDRKSTRLNSSHSQISYVVFCLKKKVKMAAESRVPAMYWTSDYMEVGGLMSYAESLNDLGRRAAGYVDRILKRAKPADLPVVQPTKFELLINLKTAKALGLTIPQALLLRADQVI